MSPKRVTKPLDIYVRVSDVRGRAGDSFISPDEQEHRCRAAIASRGLEVGAVFQELDVSGKSMERPELAKVRKRIEAGESGGIVVARIDRFGRTVARALDAIEEIDKAGGVVITAEGDFDTSTAVGELVLGMML
jgi:site-specific DNA recombinase